MGTWSLSKLLCLGRTNCLPEQETAGVDVAGAFVEADVFGCCRHGEDAGPLRGRSHSFQVLEKGRAKSPPLPVRMNDEVHECAVVGPVAHEPAHAHDLTVRESTGPTYGYVQTELRRLGGRNGPAHAGQEVAVLADRRQARDQHDLIRSLRITRFRPDMHPESIEVLGGPGHRAPYR